MDTPVSAHVDTINRALMFLIMYSEYVNISTAVQSILHTTRAGFYSVNPVPAEK